MGMDHRWGQRQATNVEVLVARAGTAWAARVANISLTGAYLETSAPLHLHSLVYLIPVRDILPETNKRVAANVVRNDARGVGLEWCEALSKGTHIDLLLAMLSDL